jgi:hypothetical protein
MVYSPIEGRPMSKKRVTLLGTMHYNVRNAPAGVRERYEFIIDQIQPQVVLEEWSIVQKDQSAAASAADSKGVPWVNIGTPASEEFWTFGQTYALDFPNSTNIPKYGPLAAQEKRETAMCENIRDAMATHDSAVIVIGLAHLHSIYAKLANDFDVDGYGFTTDFLL